jgi:hypothetical protein
MPNYLVIKGDEVLLKSHHFEFYHSIQATHGLEMELTLNRHLFELFLVGFTDVFE